MKRYLLSLNWAEKDLLVVVVAYLVASVDHLDLVLAEVLVDEVHVGDLLGGALRRQVEVEHA